MGIFKHTNLDNIQLKNDKALAKKQMIIRKTDPMGKWPREVREKVVTAWLLTGNMRQASEIAEVPYKTVRAWKHEAWWLVMEKELRIAENLVLDKKLSEIVEKSLTAALDRIDNGDFIYDQKTGEMRRKPAALRDLHRVAVDVLGKRELIRDKNIGKDSDNQASIDDHLKILAGKMAQWFEKDTKPIIELTEVEDAIYEERPSGLQGGGEVGEDDSPGTGEGTSPEECSTPGGDESWDR